MLLAMTWFVVLVLASIYSAGVWLLHAIAVWSLSGVGALAGSSPAVGAPSVPAWAGVWLPAEWLAVAQAGGEAAMPWIEAALAALPSLAQWLTPMAWALWAVGLLLLLVAGGLVHLLVAMARRTAAP